MASEIKVDTIVNAGGDNDTGIDLATNDQILLKVANATRLTMNSTGQTTIVGEGGTNTTSLQQGLTKVWVTFDGTASGATVRDSFNVTSTDDDGTGIYGVNFTTSMGNANFSSLAQRAVLTGAETTGTANCNRMTTGSIDKVQAYGDDGSLADRDNITCHVTGDLA
jgi:hypothetical protein